MSICEIRIPTYKRPELLKRALYSVVDQTYSNWKAIVFDDSLEQEAKSIVNQINDNRIIYKPHKKNLGRSKNIDYAFFPKSYFDGTYACVLEDDNYFLPDFITKNIKSIETNNVGIVLRNQEIRLEKKGDSIVTGRTTRDHWFEQGLYNPIQIYARLFFSEGISNGGLFWHTHKIKSNLQVGSQVENSWHQEVFRTLNIQELIYFESNPQCVFTEFYQEENLSNGILNKFNQKYKSLKGAPQHNRATQAILTYLVKNYGSQIIIEADKIAVNASAKRTLERQLLSTFYLNYKFEELSYLEIIQYLCKYGLRYFLFKSPFQDLLINNNK
jgi:glycosyltransferase involved in cell wall biosynthesis